MLRTRRLPKRQGDKETRRQGDLLACHRPVSLSPCLLVSLSDCGEVMMAGRSIRTFTVLPFLPERLQALHQLAYNMWWCWNHEAVSLFRRVDDDLFDAVENSPVKLLGAVDQNRVEQLLRDDGFLVHMDRVEEALNTYMTSPTWFQETYPTAKDFRVAYLSAEFGIHESIPIYSGGLGLLAGDHLKAASELGLPLVGVS